MDAREEFLKTLADQSPPEFAELVRKHTVVRSFESGSFLALEADECNHLPVVLTGCVRIFKSGESGREITLYRIDAGESCILTATCILNAESFPAQAMVEETSEVLLIPALSFLDWMDRFAFWRTYVYSMTTRRLASVLTTVTEIAFARMDARIAEYLRRARNKSQSKEAVIKITHQALADELGTAREVVSRILKDLEKRGALRLSRGGITLLDTSLLDEASNPVDSST